MRINYNPVPQNSYFNGNKIASQKDNNNNPAPTLTPITDIEPDVLESMKDTLFANLANAPKPAANGSRIPGQ